MTTERTTWEHLEAVHAGTLELPAFEQWLYATPEIQAILGPDAWRALVALDYRGRFAVHELRAFVERLYEEQRPGALPADRARRIANEFLAGRRDLWSTCRALTGLRAEGNEAWVPVEFVVLDSELEEIPAPAVRALWEPAALRRLMEQRAPWLEEAHRVAREAAVQLLAKLEDREEAQRKHLLFVCSRNQKRSPTAERIFSNSERFEARSRGFRASSKRQLSAADVTWADTIFVMEAEHKRELLRQFREEAMGREIVVLDIPDEYELMDPELVDLITAGVRATLGA